MPPFCYLIVGFVIQASVQFIYSRPSIPGIDHLRALQEPLVLLVTTALLWTGLRYVHGRAHRALVSYLLSVSQLCKLNYYRRKAIVQLRNQASVAALIALCLLIAGLQNPQLALYPDEPGFNLVLLTFIIVAIVFIVQSATVPGFLRSHFFSESEFSASSLHAACHFYQIHTLSIGMICAALLVFSVGAVFLPRFTLFFLLATVLCPVVLFYQFIGHFKVSVQMQRYKAEALKSNKRKLHFLKHSARYPEQALQVAINKLVDQRRMLLDCNCEVLSHTVMKILVTTSGGLAMVWYWAL